MTPIRIAFQNICDRQWIAGCNFYYQLFRALKALPSPPHIVLVHERKSPDDSFEVLLPFVDEVLQYPPVRPFSHRVRYQVQQRTGLALHEPHPLGYLLRQARVDVWFSMKVTLKLACPQIVWIPDLQHRQLPEMFTGDEVRRRDESFTQIGLHADRVMVTSSDVQAAFAEFLPQAKTRTRVLPFSVDMSPAVYASSPDPISQRYHLPERFFYLPNQFWKHKNHLLVIAALKLLHARSPEITVVCTGNLKDYRNEGYLNHLMTAIAEAGVHTQFRLLGMIPREHVFSLIRQSVAVLQPSLFEGLSMSVAEARWLGKSLILSDLAVHREHEAPQAFYFDPHDAAALAATLEHVWQTTQPGPDLSMEADARAASPVHQRSMAEAFMAVVQELI